MDFYKVIDSRHTLRDFAPVTMDDQTIERIISAGMKAPSNDHMRDWHFIVIKDKNVVFQLLEQIPKTITKEGMDALIKNWNLNDPCQANTYRDAVPKQYRMLADASCVIIPLFKNKTNLLHPENLSHLNGLASIWCCIENMLLATTAEGYAATLRIPLGNEGEWARSVLQFPEDYVMPCFLGLGKAKEDATHPQQKEYSLKERIHKDIW